MRRFAGVTASGAATSGERCVRSAVRGYAVAVDRSCSSSSSPLSAASSAARADPAGAYVAVSSRYAVRYASRMPARVTGRPAPAAHLSAGRRARRPPCAMWRRRWSARSFGRMCNNS